MSHTRVLSTAIKNGYRLRHIHSTVPTAATIPMVETEEISLPPIADIFDVPERLGEAYHIFREKPAPERFNDSNENSLPRPPPKSLPPPIIFDGPARPRDLHLAFQRRVEQALNSAPASTRHTLPHFTPSLNTSELSVEMFEGPARISRYSHKSERLGKSGYQALLVGLIGVVGAGVLLSDKKLPSLSSSPNSKR